MKFDSSVRLSFSGVSVELSGRRILDAIDLEVLSGELVALIGPNGAGKSTLVRAALGLVPLRGNSGSISISGTALERLTGRERAGSIAWLPQQNAIHESVTCLDLVCSARFRFTEARSYSEEKAGNALDRMGVGSFASRDFTTLSGGEQQRVSMAGLLAQEAPLLLLDEPANHLDPAHQIEIYALIGSLRREGYGILCITHDINLLNHALTSGSEETPRVVGLRDGTLVFESRFSDPGLTEHLQELFGVSFQPVESSGRRHFLLSEQP